MVFKNKESGMEVGSITVILPLEQAAGVQVAAN